MLGRWPFVELGVEGRADHLGNPSGLGCGGHVARIPRGGVPGSHRENAKTRWPNAAGRGSRESGGRADDVGQLTGDLGLPGPVVLPGQRLDEVVGILGRSPHGDHPGNLLADGRVQEALEQPHLERDRDDLFEDALGVGQELVGNWLSLGIRDSACRGLTCMGLGLAHRRPDGADVGGHDRQERLRRSPPVATS